VRGWEWSLHWKRKIFDWKSVHGLELMSEINKVHLNTDNQDIWTFLGEEDGAYSVKSAYSLLYNNNRNYTRRKEIL